MPITWMVSQAEEIQEAQTSLSRLHKPSHRFGSQVSREHKMVNDSIPLILNLYVVL